MAQTLKVLVVDDSALMRKTIRGILTDAGGFEVVTARTGLDALDEISRSEPDVVTLDVNMPEMDGLSCLAEIMKTRPRPVVMVSSLTDQGAMATLEALALGAVDYVTKPGGTVSLNFDEVADDLVVKLRRATSARIRVGIRARAAAPARPSVQPRPSVQTRPAARPGSATQPRPAVLDAVLIGASTGGPPLLSEIIAYLPRDFPAPVVVAQHMPASFTGAFARRLDDLAAVSVREVTGQVRLERGCVYIGRGDADVVVSTHGRDLVARSVPASAAYRWHPSVDRLVSTARAAAEASRLVGVLLTGMGDDGAEQMTALANAGGRTIAEAEETAVVWGMPGELIRRGGAGLVLPGDRIAAQLIDWVN